MMTKLLLAIAMVTAAVLAGFIIVLAFTWLCALIHTWIFPSAEELEEDDGKR